MKYCIPLLFVSMCFTMAVSLEDPETSEVSRHVDLLAAMCEVESNCDPSKVGEANEIGWYQILPCFWEDALEHDPDIGGVYEDVKKNKKYAEKVILAYWDRYATIQRLGREPTDEDRARIHNGGPNGYKKTATVKYWNKVKNIL